MQSFEITLPFCFLCVQMQSWLGTFNPERERRKVMGCQHTYMYTHSYTESVRISACSGLSLVVTLGMCQTAGSYLTLWHLLFSPHVCVALLKLKQTHPRKSLRPTYLGYTFQCWINAGTNTICVRLCMCTINHICYNWMFLINCFRASCFVIWSHVFCRYYRLVSNTELCKTHS